MSGFYNKIKLGPADKLFSKYIRTRDKGCVFQINCFGMQDFSELQCCHFWGRARKSVRYDPQNADSGCPACHQYLHAHPEFHKEFKLKQLGQNDYDLLELRAQTPNYSFDEKLAVIYCKQLLSEL
jgi:hypothetical protein